MGRLWRLDLLLDAAMKIMDAAQLGSKRAFSDGGGGKRRRVGNTRQASIAIKWGQCGSTMTVIAASRRALAGILFAAIPPLFAFLAIKFGGSGDSGEKIFMFIGVLVLQQRRVLEKELPRRSVRVSNMSGF